MIITVWPGPGVHFTYYDYLKLPVPPLADQSTKHRNQRIIPDYSHDFASGPAFNLKFHLKFQVGHSIKLIIASVARQKWGAGRARWPGGGCLVDGGGGGGGPGGRRRTRPRHGCGDGRGGGRRRHPLPPAEAPVAPHVTAAISQPPCPSQPPPPQHC